MKILIAPFSTKLANGNPNAKNPSLHWWEEVVTKLVQQGFEVTQIGIVGEEKIKGVSQYLVNWPLNALIQVVNEHDLWLSIDSFLPHLCWTYKLKSGVVIWSQSDPEIWGHDCNINLLKSREYLRQFQYQSWPECAYNEDAFVTPDEVINAVQSLLARSRPKDGRRFVPRSVRLAQESAT